MVLCCALLCSNITTTAASGKAASLSAPDSLCDARHLPTSTHRAIHGCQATEKKGFHVKLCNTTTKTKTSQFAAGEDCYKCHNLFFFGPNDACCLTVTGDSATWLRPLPALTSAAYLDAPRSTHAHLRFAGSACAGPLRDATVSHPHNTDAHSATAAPSQGGSLLLESPPHHEP